MGVSAALGKELDTEPENGKRGEVEVEAVRHIRDFLTTRLRLYERDPALKVALSSLHHIRKTDEGSAAWWSVSENVVCGVQNESPVDEENARRVKMSEYLCLLSHIEALDEIKNGKSNVVCFA